MGYVFSSLDWLLDRGLVIKQTLVPLMSATMLKNLLCPEQLGFFLSATPPCKILHDQVRWNETYNGAMLKNSLCPEKTQLGFSLSATPLKDHDQVRWNVTYNGLFDCSSTTK